MYKENQGFKYILAKTASAWLAEYQHKNSVYICVPYYLMIYVEICVYKNRGF